MRTILLLGCLLSAFAASCGRQTPAPVLPEITAGGEEEFHDLTFAVSGSEESPDGSRVLRVAGVRRGAGVGLIVVLGPRWEKKALEANVSLITHRGTVAFRSAGTESDTLLRVLDEVYATGLRPGHMRAETSFAAISLSGDPSDLSRGESKIKLFFEAEAEDRYAELFVDIDLGNRALEIREKDPEYRKAIIRALAAP